VAGRWRLVKAVEIEQPAADMKAKTKSPPKSKTTSQEIDAIIRQFGDWRATRLSQVRALIQTADPAAVEEVKWKMPSKPLGVPVWSHEGIVCMGEALKSAVRLTFPNGALIKDPKKLFNARLDSKTVRAIDFYEGDAVNVGALQALMREAARLNTARARER
jgi:hypothetical protein